MTGIGPSEQAGESAGATVHSGNADQAGGPTRGTENEGGGESVARPFLVPRGTVMPADRHE